MAGRLVARNRKPPRVTYRYTVFRLKALKVVIDLDGKTNLTNRDSNSHFLPFCSYCTVICTVNPRLQPVNNGVNAYNKKQTKRVLSIDTQLNINKTCYKPNRIQLQSFKKGRNCYVRGAPTTLN